MHGSDSGPFDPALPPSSSLLFYLFADQVVPAARFGTATPLARHRLETDAFAVSLFNIAFWSLRDAGLVRLETDGDSVKIARTAVQQDRDGIEGGLLQVLEVNHAGTMTAARESLPGWLGSFLETSESMRANLSRVPDALKNAPRGTKTPPGTVTETVARWYGSHVRDPGSVPIQWMEREATVKGCLQLQPRKGGAIASLFFGKTVLVPRHDRIAELAPRFEDLLSRWRTFQTSEAGLFRLLDRAIAAGIEARRDTSDTGSAN